MINILLNDTNFDGDWAAPYLIDLIKPGMHVLVMPLSASEGWSADEEDWDHRFKKGGKEYEKIMTPLRKYRIKDTDVEWYNHHLDSKETLREKMHRASMIYLYGEDAEHMMMRINDLGIHALLLQYDGAFIGNAAGSSLMMETFDSKYAWEDEEVAGLGLLRGFALMPDYVEDAGHLARLIRSIEQRGKAVFAFPAKGGVIIQDGRYELIGDAFTVSDADLDNIYNAYEDAKSRQEYYGSNGLYEDE